MVHSQETKNRFKEVVTSLIHLKKPINTENICFQSLFSIGGTIDESTASNLLHTYIKIGLSNQQTEEYEFVSSLMDWLCYKNYVSKEKDKYTLNFRNEVEVVNTLQYEKRF